jgi:hypothetical protein
MVITVDQAATRKAARRRHRRMLRWSAAYLAIVSICSLILVALLLSGFQAYQRLKITKVEGTQISYFTLARLATETKERDDLLATVQNQISKLDKDKAQGRTDIREREIAAQKLEFRQDALIASIYQKTSDPNLVGLSGNYLQKRFKISKLTTLPAESVSEFNQANQSDLFNDERKAIARLEAEDKALEKKRDLLVDRKLELATERESFGGENAVKDIKKNVMDLVDEVRQTAYLSTLMTTYLPEELLIVMIVIAGGLLGSAVFLTYDYVEDTPPRTLAYLSLRLLVGALTSLLLFIVIKAGVVVAIDTPALDAAKTDLNPFFVAFIGVLGGLISHQVVSKIMAAANSWFQDASAGKERYVLRETIEGLAPENTRLEFIKFAGYSSDAIDRWTKAGGLVSPAGQRAVSLFLHKDIRDLFSDIPPMMDEPAIKKQSSDQSKTEDGETSFATADDLQDNTQPASPGTKL